ncbi:CG34297 [Drosophila busckii]|uniref:CG34297 n=1 Tax=Drosophila busckii TaxID=30019 RepID=A0A0M5J0A2_DROBS|nr:tetratricopeptide repeat protein 12 [Drosophila busckii]ALC47361.1 CG34297 [Drosophila busckii]
MFSLQHAQTDEAFLKLNSQLEEVTLLLRSLIKPTEEGAANAATPLTAESVTEDNFIVTRRRIKAETETRPRRAALPKNDKFTFMRQVEVDLKERSKARLEREHVAQKFRKLGNAAYRDANYEHAIQMYSQGIENIEDSPILYINRALCFIKLTQFKRGIIDCDYVLNKLDEKNLRAWLYRAMAYRGLNDEANFENCIKYARKYHSKQLEYIANFLLKLKQLE